MARKTKKIQQRNKFIIITNGKETETNYFTLLRGYLHSIYDIKVKFANADPVGLLNQAIQEKDSSNQVWIVFDKDEFSNDIINNTILTANKNDIGVAFSNIAFEVWLINHFKEFNQDRNASELISILDKLLKDQGYAKGYKKNDSKVFSSMLFPHLEFAVHNSNVSLQKRISDYNSTHSNNSNYPYWDWNSCTTVHKLIDALKFETKC